MTRLSYWLSLVRTKDEDQRIDITELAGLVGKLVYAIISRSNRQSIRSVLLGLGDVEKAPPSDWTPPDDHLTSGVLAVEDDPLDFKTSEAVLYLENQYDTYKDKSVNLIEWDIKIIFEGEFLDPSDVSKLIWALSEALKTVGGVSLELEDWGRGSYWVRIKARIEDTWKRDEVQQILDTARDGVVSEYLERPIQEVGKTEQEKLKLESERKRIERETEALPDAGDAARKRDLEMASSELDLMRQKAEIDEMNLKNKMLQLDMIRKASDMVKDGIISADPVQIEINSLKFIALAGSEVDPGADMDDISGRRLLGPKKPDNPTGGVGSD